MANYGYLLRFFGSGKRYLVEHHKTLSLFKIDSKSISMSVKFEAPMRRFNLNKKGVRETYLAMHSNQTVSFVKEKRNYWLKFDKTELSVMDALDELKDFVDESDPDVTVSNIFHAYQTAEGIRKVFPNQDWFHLTGLVHDLGKIMCSLDKPHREPQWAVVGDTYPVGCAYADSIVYGKTTFKLNLDFTDPRYNTKFGIYEKNCGLDKVLMCWGHDEYLYQVLINHQKCKLPEEALYMIRYHSFYPWHTGNEEHICNEKDLKEVYKYICNEKDLKRDYDHLCNSKDLYMLPWIRKFNEFDLYTKDDNNLPVIEQLKPYYQSLIDKYIPGLVKW